jgi:hypothetical protein
MSKTRERSLRVIGENTDKFALKNINNREQSANILFQIFEKNSDKYNTQYNNLTKKEKDLAVDDYMSEIAPTTVYDKYLKNSMPEHIFYAMVNESNVRSRNEVLEEKSRINKLTPAQRQAEALAVKNAKIAHDAFLARVKQEEREKRIANEISRSNAILGLGVRTKKRRGKKSKKRIRRS